MVGGRGGGGFATSSYVPSKSSSTGVMGSGCLDGKGGGPREKAAGLRDLASETPVEEIPLTDISTSIGSRYCMPSFLILLCIFAYYLHIAFPYANRHLHMQ